MMTLSLIRIGSISILGALITTMWLVARAILYPTVQTAQKVQGAFRFHLVDSVWLSVQIQLALAAIVAWVPRIYPEYFAIVLTSGVLGTIALWAGAIQFLSKAGIVEPMRRGIFVLIYLPGALATLIVGPLVIGGALTWMTNVTSLQRFLLVLGAGLLLLVLAGAGYLLRQLGWWLVGSTQSSLAQNETWKSIPAQPSP